MAAYFEQVLGGTYDNHVLPFLWLKGEARETITEYLEQIAGADIREVCLESRTHPDFCRDGWWSDLRFIIGECKRLGLKIWLLDDAHFPTGYANGALAGDGVDPALKKTVLKHRTVTVVGPQPSTTTNSVTCGSHGAFVGAAVFDAAGAPLGLEFAVEESDDGTPARLRFDAPPASPRSSCTSSAKRPAFAMNTSTWSTPIRAACSSTPSTNPHSRIWATSSARPFWGSLPMSLAL